MAAIKDTRISALFQSMKADEHSGRVSGRSLANPELFHKLTISPAHSEIILEGAALGDEIKESFYDAKSNQFLYKVLINTEVYYQGSKEPIGDYKSGKFEARQFKLKSQVIITKK